MRDASSQPSRIFSVTGTRDCLHDRVDQGQRMIEVAHQRRAGRTVGHVFRRTAHIDVDDVGAGAFRDTRALAHPIGFAAGDLHHMQARAMIRHALLRDVRPLSVALFGERGASGHFRDHEARAKARRLAAERRIGDAQHRRQKHRIGQIDRADRHRFSERFGRRFHGRCHKAYREKITLKLLAGIVTVSTSLNCGGRRAPSPRRDP